MADLLTKIELKLNDLFSPGMAKAGEASNSFAGKTIGACNQVDKALSGTAAKLGALGVTLSLGAAAKGIIDLDHRMTRMGLTANATAEQVSHMKQAIYDVAQASDVKLDPTSILSGLEVVMARTGDLKYAEENIRNIGLAIQATGESGDSIGALLSEFHNFKYSSEQISALMDDMAAQASKGTFSLADFAQSAPLIFSTLNAKGLGTAPENIKKTNAALQIISAGTKSPTKAITSFNSAMEELTDPEKRNKLKNIGIDVIDPATKSFRDFNDIMLEIAKKSEDARSADYLNEIFNANSMQAIRAYITHGERMHDSLVNLGDTAGLLQSKAATMAGTLKSNIQGLQTAFNKFADSNLSKPLEQLTGFLNKMSEDPKRVEAVFEAIKRGVLIIGGLKIGAGIMSFINTLRDFTGGSGNITGNINANITESLSASQAMPVYVTNWGGVIGNPIGASAMPGVDGGGLLDQFGKPMAPAAGSPMPQGAPAPQGAQPPAAPQSKWKLNNPNWKGAAMAGAGAAAITAVVALPGLLGELGEIKKNNELTREEKGKAKGGAVGQFAGSVTGAAAGAFAGAAIGSVVPVVGTAVGALVGGLIGQFGGPVGRMIGEKIGAAVSAQSPEKAKAAFDRAQAEYDDAIREAANTVGKTARDMEKARQKVREAETRLEEAKADLETSRAAVPQISPEEAQAAFDEAQAGYAAAISDAGEAIGKTGDEMEEAYRKYRENEMNLEAAKSVLEKAQADLDAAISDATNRTGKANWEIEQAYQKTSEARMQLDAAKAGLEASQAAASEALPGHDALEKAQADYAAAIDEAANAAGSEERDQAYQRLHEVGIILEEAENASREIEQVFQNIRESETRMETAKAVLETPQGAEPKLSPQQAQAAFVKAQADFDAARLDAMNRKGKSNWEIEQAHQKVSEMRAQMEAAKSALDMSQADSLNNPLTQGRQLMIPKILLPHQITRTESSIGPPKKAEAEITGNALLEVKVDISGERPTAQAVVKNNAIPHMSIRNTGNAREARYLAL